VIVAHRLVERTNQLLGTESVGRLLFEQLPDDGFERFVYLMLLIDLGESGREHRAVASEEVGWRQRDVERMPPNQHFVQDEP
jgi:hypothetical protein